MTKRNVSNLHLLMQRFFYILLTILMMEVKSWGYLKIDGAVWRRR